MNLQSIFRWLARFVAAGIMLQTLFFKFTAAPESVYIFSTLHLEPVGRIASGVAELIASVLLLIPRTSWMGALLGLGVMVGAIGSHLFVLGIEIQGDGGLLFAYALTVFAACLYIVLVSYRQVVAGIGYPGRWRQFVVLLVVLGSMSACTSDPELKPVGTIEKPVSAVDNTKTFDATGQKLLIEGSFMNNVHTVKGTVKVYEKEGTRTLLFENFSTDSGPDLRIYLAEDTGLTNAIEVQKLTTIGSFFLKAPAGFDPVRQRTILIWCKSYSVLFGHAKLQ
ncbi:DM13 domain-containing protein [Larkinella rosea]|uniref:DM13 domain-containing protein n=1 Tax=Larkinella rosea TaxID=2025312 RepID=A0A3P1BSB4_9BACT|nr:DM13 domain-containing protein [Larkinella rosea]RRB03990.1 hypothetical protein EHT25_10695 [Larkinella rosea]